MYSGNPSPLAITHQLLAMSFVKTAHNVEQVEIHQRGFWAERGCAEGFRLHDTELSNG